MSTPLIQDLPYFPDSALLFEPFTDKPWSVLLESGEANATGKGMDIIVSDPSVTLTTWGAATEIRTPDGVRRSSVNPFSLVREMMGAQIERSASIPFPGGMVGFFGYDLARRLERLPTIAIDDSGLPDMALGLYDWAVLVDHQRETSHLVGQGRDPRTRRNWNHLVERFSRPVPPRRREPFRVEGGLRSNLDYPEYCRAFVRIQRYIRDGDCYQVNFSQRFEAGVRGDPWFAYELLRRRNPAPFGGFLATPWGEVLSCSPERFLKVVDRSVETKPIKGTAPRGETPEEDERLRKGLLHSAKDRAENLMIVDLLRNDLSKNCDRHSVKVPALFQIESYASVHHLVSQVSGQLAPGKDALTLLEGAFPGGSITGAPKLRAMEIIESLEPNRRGIYCGSIGYIGFDGSMDTNIAIRTLTHRGGEIRFSAGGGIVADSDCRSEYEETLHKVRALLDLFEAPSS